MNTITLIFWLWLIGTFVMSWVFSAKCDKLEKRIEELERKNRT